jgi:carboxylesterase
MVEYESKTPFFFEGGNKGVLFIHGFTGSPADMEPMARFFNEAGFSCLGINLKGHGTDCEDMAVCSDYDWIQDAALAYARLRETCSSVYVCGLSMGGSLGLYLAENYCVDGLVSMAAPVYIRISGALPGINITKRLKKLINAEAEMDYDSIPLSWLESLGRLIRNTARDLCKVKCPVLVVQSGDDSLVRPGSARFIYDHVSSGERELLWLQGGGHNVVKGDARDEVFDTSLRFVKSHAGS